MTVTIPSHGFSNGDEVKIAIEKLGFINNKVIEEPEDTPAY